MYFAKPMLRVEQCVYYVIHGSFVGPALGAGLLL